MKTLLVSAALAASMLTSTAVSAQAVPAAVIVVVDSNRAANECNACKTASAALRTQATAFENRKKTLGTQLETERNSIQTAVDALKGKDPDAALQNRIKAFQAKAQQAEQELANSQQRLQSINVNILRQIRDKLDPAVRTVMTQRGANLALETTNTLSSVPALDVTNQVIAQLNSTLPSISVTPLPQQQAPQGR
jgi:Skp family chaperone for outer membrane proteins